jgi:predicted nuclease of predicted toxin-antitoxin system
MKLLFDENISSKLCQRLSDIFPNSNHIKAFHLETREDIQIWEFAKHEDLVIVTQDSDFDDISSIWGFPPYVIWLRTGNTKVMAIEKVLRQNYLKIIEIVEAEKLGGISVIYGLMLRTKAPRSRHSDDSRNPELR